MLTNINLKTQKLLTRDNQYEHRCLEFTPAVDLYRGMIRYKKRHCGEIRTLRLWSFGRNASLLMFKFRLILGKAISPWYAVTLNRVIRRMRNSEKAPSTLTASEKLAKVGSIR